MRLLVVLVGVLCGAILTGCYQEPVAIATPTSGGPSFARLTLPPSTRPPTATGSAATATPRAPATPIDLSTPTSAPITTPTSAPTPAPTTATPEPIPSTVAGGSPSPGCHDGWITPSPVTPEFAEAFAIIEGFMGVEGPWTINEIRYFTGPDSPGVIEPRHDVVERWYVRAALVSEPSFRGRWLIEKRTDLVKGISAVASWESVGYQSPDWTGFVGEGEPQTYIGLPGQWSGIPYDFVTGEGDSGNPGLPPEVVDCLAGT